MELDENTIAKLSFNLVQHLTNAIALKDLISNSLRIL